MSMAGRSLRAFVTGVCLVGIACGGDDKRASYERGLAQHEQQHYREAALEFRKALQQDPKFAEAHQALARTLKAAGDSFNAHKEFVRAADLLPNDAAAQVEAANALLSVRRFPDAKARAEQALKLDPKNSRAQLILGNALAAVNDLDTAMEELERAIELDPASSLPLLSLGAVRLAKGDDAQAKAAFEQAVNNDPKDVAPRLALGNFYWSLKDYPAAESAFKAAAALDAADPRPHRALAMFQLSLGRIAEAEAPLKQFAALSKGTAPHMLLADYYVATGRLPDAEAAARAVVGTPGGFSTARIRLAAVKFRQGQPEEAHRLLDEALGREPNNAPVLSAKASLLLATGDAVAAVARARAAVAADPASALPHKTLGAILAATGELDEASREYLRAVEISPAAVSVLLELSALNLRRGGAEAAQNFAREVLKRQPDNVVAHLLVARALAAQGDFTNAAASLNIVRTAYPKSALVQTDWGNLALKRKQYTEAEQAFVTALQLDGSRDDALEGLVEARLAAGKVRDADEITKQALAARPKDGGVLYVAARVAAAQGDAASTERLLRAAVEADGNDLKAYSALGRLYVAGGRLDEAIDNYRKLAGRGQRTTALETMIGMLLEAKGDRQSARAQYERIVGTDARAAVAANNLAWMYAEDGQLDRALELAQRANQVRPDDPDIVDTLGWIYLKKDVPALAVGAFESCVAKHPGAALCHYHLGLTYLRRGDRTRARGSFERALALPLEQDAAADARRQLAALGPTG